MHKISTPVHLNYIRQFKASKSFYPQRLIIRNHGKKTTDYKSRKVPPFDFKLIPPNMSIVELAKSVDTTLTPEQKVYVESLKKKIKGADPRKRSLYRDVPTADELKVQGNFQPLMAENAEALIDYALSKVPKRDGPRRSRFKKRLEARRENKRQNDKRRKMEAAAARLRKEAKLKKRRQLVAEIRKQAIELGYSSPKHRQEGQ